MNEEYEKGYDAGVLATVEECQRLQHNWNELKKWLEEETRQYWNTDILEKMQSLEEGGNNE